MSYSPFGGLARSSTARAQSSPCCFTLALSALVMRNVCRSVRASSGGAGGRPRGRFSSSMLSVYVRQKRLAKLHLLADNKYTNQPEHIMSNQQRKRLEYLESIEFPTPEENKELRELLNVENDDFIARTRG